MDLKPLNRLKIIGLLGILSLAGSITAQDEWSLRFDGNKLHHIKSGPFYTPNTSYTHSPFFAEAWIKPGDLSGGRYWIAQGYGGSHILLIGVVDAEPGRVGITGNLANPTTHANSFRSLDSTARGAWAHHAVLYVPANHFGENNPATPTVYTFVNGILSSQTAVTNPRESSGSWHTGSNTLEIGGTDHSNFDGNISQVRLFEGSVPFVYDQGYGGSGAASFVPERSFRGGFYHPNDTVRAGVSLLYDFRRPTGKTIPDLGIGFNGGTHTGVMSSGHSSYGQFGEPDNYDIDLPTWVNEPMSFNDASLKGRVKVPATAVLFDSFSRSDVTPASRGSMALGLGRLEKGGTWQGSASQYGVLSQRAFGVANAVQPIYANVGVANMDVRVRSGDSFNATTLPTVYARYSSPGDHLSLYYYNGYIYVAEMSGGNIVQSASLVYPGGSDRLRISVSGSTASFYVGDTQVHTLTNITLTGTNAGFSMTGMNRIDTFEVY